MRKFFLLAFVWGVFALMCPAQDVKIIFAGDLMGHDRQIQAALQSDSTYDYTPCFRYIKDYVSSADLAILNLEVTLAGPPYNGYPTFSSPVALAQAAKDAGFDIMTTANNHCLDRDKQGLESTIQALDSLGIPHLGTYINQIEHDNSHPMTVCLDCIKLALLNYTCGTNGRLVEEPNIVNYIDTVAMQRDLDKAKAEGHDFIITLIHWGIEYDTRSSAEQEYLAKWLLEHGSDAVMGSHPHVVQNFTVDAIPDNDRYPEIVVYSMGNLVSNQRKINTDGGIMIEMDLRKTGDKTVVTDCHYLPYWVYRGTIDGLYQYYILPSNDAMANRRKYQINREDYKALKLFSKSTRARLDSCALNNGINILERR